MPGWPPAALGKPVSREIQEQMAKTKRDVTETAGWLEGSEDKQETTGSGSASLQGLLLRSLQTGPCPRRGEVGRGGWGGVSRGGTEPGSWQLSEPQLPARPGTASAPTEHVQRAGETELGSAGPSADTARRTHARTHTHSHTCALTRETRTPKVRASAHPRSSTVLAGYSPSLPLFTLGYALPARPSPPQKKPQRFFS